MIWMTVVSNQEVQEIQTRQQKRRLTDMRIASLLNKHYMTAKRLRQKAVPVC